MSVLKPAGTRRSGDALAPHSPTVDIDSAEPPIDHVWSNVRVFLRAGRVERACQIGGDALGPHLAKLADFAVAVGPRVRGGPGLSAVIATGRTPLADASFDLVVIQDADRADDHFADPIGDARRLCAPDGRIVVGSSSIRAGIRLRRRLRGQPVRTFWALPGPRRPAVLVAARSRDAARYFMRRIAFAYRTPEARGLSAHFEQARHRVALLAPPRVALAAASRRVQVVRSGASDSLFEDLEGFVRSSWSDLGLPGRKPEGLTPLVIGHRKSELALISVLLFGGSETLVAKLPRYGGVNSSLRREDAVLGEIFHKVTGPLRATLPRPLGIHSIGGTEMLLQTVVPGRHLVAETATRRLRREALNRQFDTMFSWSSALQAETRRSIVVNEELIEERLVSAADAAVAALDGDERVETLLDGVIEHARRLVGTLVDLVVVHGDFWAGNVLVERGRVSGVVDWERASASDLPIWDPVKAVLDAAYHLDRYRSVPRRGSAGLPEWGELGPWQGVADPRFGVGFRAALVQPGWFSDMARGVLTTAFTKTGIPLGWLPVAVPFHLVREFTHADASPGSLAGWGSVLRALAYSPGTWADEFAGERTGPAGGTSPDVLATNRQPERE